MREGEGKAVYVLFAGGAGSQARGTNACAVDTCSRAGGEANENQGIMSLTRAA